MSVLRSTRSWLVASVLLSLGGAVGCSDGATDVSGGAGVGGGSSKPPVVGATDFVSADAVPGQEGKNGADAQRGGSAGASATAPEAGLSDEGAADSDPRAVAEGDIYRVLDNGTILNLNSYRGLQVIDVSDPAAPAIIGRVAVLGTPLEMYVRDDRAYVLLNDWEGYYGTRDDVNVERREGGLLAVIDLSDRRAPRQLASEVIRGYIRTSRLVSNDSSAALYVASSWSGPSEDPRAPNDWIERTVVTSFDVADDRLAKQSELDLGGYVQDIQATPDRLLVASSEYSNATNTNTVALVDISDPNGQMVLGDSVVTQGRVQSQFNMDLYNGVLRVVSTDDWTGQSENAVETFDAHDIENVTRIDRCAFGDGQQLYATLFLENKAFFVTYFRQDPFHAFAIDDDGQCAEQNEFVVSGWNDFFRPVAGGTRLIGVGTDDADASRTPAVSLYDITDLRNQSPLLARATAGALDWSWSEANSDHRAFTVLENAVQVPAANGTLETGLVLLPFEGQSTTADNRSEYFTRVQIFTFSDDTVTRRGTMDHDSPVRRSFPAREGVTANLSENSLALHDPSDPDKPQALGKVELAPDYGRVLRFGDYVARLQRPNNDVYYEADQNELVPEATVALLAAEDDMNGGAPVATFKVPADARLLKAGNLLVSVVYRYVSEDATTDEYRPIYHTTVQAFDLSDPTRPRAGGKAETDDLQPTSFGYGGGYFDGGWGGGRFGMATCGVGSFWFDGAQTDGVIALGNVLAFTTAEQQQKVVGHERRCNWNPQYDSRCDNGECEDLLQGWRQCSWLDGKAEGCTGEFARCDLTDGRADCTPVDFEDVEGGAELQKYCYENERSRYWTRYSFRALDLSDPKAPKFGATIAMPKSEEAVSVLPSGKSLYYSYKLPTELDSDTRPHVRHFFKQISFSDPASPQASAAVNVPGELIAIDGKQLYTKDVRWGESSAQTYVHELERAGDLATLQASHGFAEREVSKVVAEDGRVYVTHGPLYNYGGYYYETGAQPDAEEQRTKLTLLAAGGLDVSSEVDIDVGSSFQAVHGDRALFTVPGGLMIINVEDAAAPRAQAFFNTTGWPEQILFEGNDVLIAAGRYGVHRFASDEWNLLNP